MPPNHSPLIALAALTIGGCALLQPAVRPVQAGKADLFVDQASFDGEELAARVLIRARGGDLTVQEDLHALGGLTVEDARDCETGALVPFVEFVVVVFEPDRLERLANDHWFGVDTKFPIYSKKLSGWKPPPECVDFEIVWWMPHPEDEPSRPVSAFVRVHTQYSDAGEPAAGTNEPIDAGTTP